MANRLFTKEQEEYLKSIVKGHTNTEIALMINEKFNTNYEVKQIKNIKNRLKLSSQRLFTKEQRDYLEKICKGLPSEEITKLMNEKYNESWTREQITKVMQHHHIVSGYRNFNKGDKHYRYKPIGSEFKRDNGFIEIKIANPSVWVLKHKWVYEQHYGKIPEGYIVCFKDGNRSNCDINNLILVKHSDSLMINNLHLISKDEDLTRVGMLLVTLTNEIKERKKKYEETRICKS